MINYYLITKPGIIIGNLFTFAAAFFLASKGEFFPGLFLASFGGLALIMASACVFNNYIDREIDQKMQRTRNRALVTGAISPAQALTFATMLGLLGHAVLFLFTNGLTTLIAAIGFFVYVVLYSVWKRHTVYSTAIGSVAGAVPPLVGYCAVSDRIDLGAVILFAMLVLWQMPHFFSVAINNLKDYTAADIPVLPVRGGMLKTKIRMVVYIVAFIFTACLLTLFHYTGYFYLVIISTIGIAWLRLAFKGFERKDEQLWGKQMFQLSLLMIFAICVLIPLDVI